MLIKKFIEKVILKNFFKIKLSSEEREMAIESIKLKYVRSIRNAFISGILILPAILFLDSTYLVGILIPIAMITGTAWFTVSLANLKRKFQSFGLELTLNLFNALTVSLLILMLLAFVSLNQAFLLPLTLTLTNLGINIFWIKCISGILGTLVVLNLIKNLFFGSLKYDINDSMLTGQQEVAEKYFKQSLSALSVVAEKLKTGKNLSVANYYLGTGFYELYRSLKKLGLVQKKLNIIKDNALILKNNSNIEQKEADLLSLKLIKNFLSFCINMSDKETIETYQDIQVEIKSIENNKNEEQKLVDTRFAVIFEKIAKILENQGESLFRKE